MSGRLSEGTRRHHADLASVDLRVGDGAVSVGLALLVILPSALIAGLRGFDGLYGQDAYAYYDYAVHSVRQSVLHVSALEAFFWPPGYPLLVAFASLVTGVTPLAGVVVSLAMGAAIPVLTYALARQLAYQRAVSVIAGVLAAVPGQLWQSSVVVMADTTGLALASLSAWALVRYRVRGTIVWLLIASAAIAYATLTRWIYGLVAVPFGIYALLALPRRKWWHALAALALVAVIVVPVVGGSVVEALTRPQAPAAFAGNLEVYSWSPMNALRTQFDTVDGHLAYTLPNGVYYAIAPANLAFWSPLIAPWVLAGLWRTFRGWPLRNGVLVVGWAVVVYAFHAGAPWQNFRFALAYLPPMAILAATGLGWAWSARDVRLRALAGVCALSLLGTLLNGPRLLQGFIDRKDDELALVRWVSAQVDPRAQLFTFGPTLAFRQYTSLSTLDLFDLSGAELQSDLGEAVDAYALVDEASIAAQWENAAPGANLAAIRTTRSLGLIGTHGSYTLYRLDPR